MGNMVADSMLAKSSYGAYVMDIARDAGAVTIGI